MTASSLTGRNRLSPAEFTLLGMIALASRQTTAIHGYDLARQMTDGPIREVIRVEPGMLYHYLKKLANRGYISSTTEPQEGRPARHVHTLTDDGRAVIEAWLAEPVHATREMRLDFLLKLWFSRQLDPDRAETLVQAQREVLDNLISSLEEQLAQIADTTSDDRFARRVIGLRLAQNRAAERWLADLEHES